MTCLSENVLSAFVEGHLSRDEASLFHAHLDECADCRSLVAGVLDGRLGGSAVTVSLTTMRSLGTADTVAAGDDTTPPLGQRVPSGPPRVEGYRIVRRIGRGAMGEVYLAQDEQLDRPVAIKFLSATSEPKARQRFLMEARAVARLRHPHIVTIYSSDITGERPYIVSELLSGRSLDRVDLPLSPAEAVRIAGALASGLAAAHRQGVLHRDIKPANAMLTDEGEIKLLDFGLAKLVGTAVEHEGAAPEAIALDFVRRTMTRTGGLVGTPLYMAPELWRGEPATPASDVYSLGAMLYELCAGRPAHRATTMEALRREVGQEAPKPLRQVAAALDPAFTAIVDRCLSRDPAARFVSAVELSAALETPAAPATPAARRGAPGRTGALLAAAGLMAALGLGIATLRGRSVHDVALPAAGERGDAARSARRSVAIVPFVDATPSPDTAWLSTALSETLGTCFGAGEVLRIVPGEEVARMFAELDLQRRASFGEEELRRIRQYASVDLVVTGTFERVGKSSALRVRASLRDTTSGAAVAAGEADGAEEAFRDVAIQLGQRLLPGLGQLPLSDVQAAQVRAAMPGSPLAARLYAEGLERYRAYDNEAARERFERAAQAEPDSAMPHHRLAVLWAVLAQDENERRETKLALQRASGLLREQRLQIEALHYQAHLEKGRALETLSMLHEFFPDNVEYGIDLAREQSRDEALATLATLRKLPPPAGEDPRIGITESLVGGVISERIAAARRAAETGRARGARFIVGTARNLEGWALSDGGDMELAQEAWNDAIAILLPRGHVVEATEAMRGLARIATLRDDLDATLAGYEAAEAHLRRSGNHASLIYALQNVASVLGMMGFPEKGRPRIEEALSLSERSGNRTRLAQSYYSVGVLELTLGNIAAARRAHKRSLAICEENKEPWVARNFHTEVGQLYFTAGELDSARGSFERVLAGTKAEGRKHQALVPRRQLALLAIEQGQLDEAALHLDEAMAEAEREKAPIQIALTAGARARLLLARGDLAGAVVAVDSALPRVARTKNLIARLQTTLDWTHVHALQGGDAADLARVEKLLAEAATSAERAGFGVHLREARLIECELLSARKATARARACFQRVATAARGQGLLLIARRASQQVE